MEVFNNDDSGRRILCLILSIISLVILHFLLRYTKIQHEKALEIAEWIPMVIALVLAIGITFYYA
jgi:hypothetical protein